MGTRVPVGNRDLGIWLQNLYLSQPNLLMIMPEWLHRHDRSIDGFRISYQSSEFFAADTFSYLYLHMVYMGLHHQLSITCLSKMSK